MKTDIEALSVDDLKDLSNQLDRLRYPFRIKEEAADVDALASRRYRPLADVGALAQTVGTGSVQGLYLRDTIYS